ncbi:acyl-coenzyme A amino acid N-acyltransferase 2 isoform X2 [Aplysia californica]|uniref:Acyl-coenzyme A amino acid N-acyltransferase 2 isoform X2 n=1 Tax=Aplysia californica TaxID=6500 RepID=A0ABM0JT37_APLCA|nr:acyl-coenzyme A amino acid N-acyltransferase 2 isoform X2 [Aplysia californica]XP_005100866.1 acyl-coenzyme A amino acid N-acyltransferase 2 isoform X2 [Aplysia californica]XP_005100867.1 acyl-coenzyme A amino acid N-acyltransferase 2 isoform X2 [Aplysia californica]XP_012939360.1 acyl-coenzyme A amino acid N-acyltransferase 2 isoform X2 [Aplysia californica]
MAVRVSELTTAVCRLLATKSQIVKSSACLSSSAPQIELSSSKALIDDPVRIVVNGLKQRQPITLQIFLEEGDKTYGACSHYVANDTGKVDTFERSSVGGTYTGLEPMGLFWSLKTTPGVKPGRLTKADVMKPFNVMVSVQDGFMDFEQLQWSADAPSMVSTMLERTYAADGIRRIPIAENGVYGTLFLPPGKGPFPALIDVFGLTGGIMEHRSALLASRGYAAFSIAYVRHMDLPESEVDLDFNYFLKAYDLLYSHPDVDKDNVGGIATCVGGGYAMLIADYRPSMKCLVSINGTGFPIGRTQQVEGRNVKPVKFKFDKISKVEDMVSFRTMFEAEDEMKSPEAWRHGGKFLFIQGEDDQCVNPAITKLLKKRISSEFHKNVEFITYPGAGHILEPPYAPLCRCNWNAIFKMYMLWGGDPKLHAHAQADSWPKILNFLNRNLTQPR